MPESPSIYHAYPQSGLYSIGRNGEFAHLLMEDIDWRMLKRMGDVAGYVGQDIRGTFPMPAAPPRWCAS